MKLSLRWLQRHVDLSGIEPRQIVADLTMSTAEIEGLEPFGAGLECLLVGRVVAVDKHPDADKLSVCQVLLGSGPPLQIVCGASNVEQGQKVVVITPGNTLPDRGGKGALKIKVSKIRGVESNGMICSEDELGLASDHDGILVLDPALPEGARFVDIVPVQDQVLEIDNKSINHRPDLWGHHGFARELAAIYGRDLLPLAPMVAFPSQGIAIPVHIDDPVGCPRYCGLVLSGVHAGRSPAQLRWLLQAVGQRAINLPVDLTNFVMLDLGQPLHAFDLERLRGHSVRVRRARNGEVLRTLDGQPRKLTDQDLLICRDQEPVALAGVMGGEGTMVAPETTALFVESANFHAATIRRTSMRLGLRTDASARFEKAQDPANAELALRHFTALLQQWCPGATVAGPLQDPAGWHYAQKTILLRRARLDNKLGVVLPDQQVRSILTSLRFGVSDVATGFDVAVPSFRATKDIAIEDDLIEEVGRMFRYDNIPERPLSSVVTPPPRTEELFLARRALEVAAGELGCCEAYNYSFVADAVLQAAGALAAGALAAGAPASGALAFDYLRVANPVAPEITRVRRHVLPSLLGCVRGNLRHSAEVRLCEHGKGYHPEVRDEHKLPKEVRELALVWSRRAGVHPYGELRQGVLVLLARLGYAAVIGRSWHGKDQPWVHPGRAAAIDRDGFPVGFVGEVHPQVLRAFELPASTAFACIDLRALLSTGRRTASYQPLPVFPPLPVDVALLVAESVQVAAVADYLQRVGKKLVRSVELFEVWRGQGLPPGQKSLNFTVTLGADDRTLDADDEAKYLARVREQAAEIGAELRG